MPTIDENFLRYYQGSTIQRDGVEYVWSEGKYEVSSRSITQNNTGTYLNKKVILKLSCVIEPSLLLSGDEVDVFVDGNKWPADLINRTSNGLEVTLTDQYIANQRLITFKTLKGTPNVRYAIKSRVSSENDVWLAKFGVDEEIPILGTYESAQISNTPSATVSTGVSTQIVTQTPAELEINYATVSENFNQLANDTIVNVVGQINE